MFHILMLRHVTHEIKHKHHTNTHLATETHTSVPSAKREHICDASPKNGSPPDPWGGNPSALERTGELEAL